MKNRKEGFAVKLRVVVKEREVARILDSVTINFTAHSPLARLRSLLRTNNGCLPMRRMISTISNLGGVR